MNARALALVAALVCCGCAGDDDTPPASTGSEPRSSQAAPSVRPVEDVLVAQLTLNGDPDWLVADEHGLWVFRQSGELTLVDPATNEVAGTVSLGETNLCSGIGASFDSVWTCKVGDVLRVDPDAMEITHRFKVRKQAARRPTRWLSSTRCPPGEPMWRCRTTPCGCPVGSTTGC